MPTYEYACKNCGHHFDIFQSFDEDSLTVCPECQGTLRKKFNSVGVVFKGSGFYRNDARSSGTGSDAPSTSTSTTSGAETSASSSGSSSTESSSSASSPAPAAKAADASN